MVALAAGKDALSDYSHKYSPHKFTQPQLLPASCSSSLRRRTIAASNNSCSTALWNF